MSTHMESGLSMRSRRRRRRRRRRGGVAHKS